MAPYSRHNTTDNDEFIYLFKYLSIYLSIYLLLLLLLLFNVFNLYLRAEVQLKIMSDLFLALLITEVTIVCNL